MTRYLSIAIARAPEGGRLTPARLADWCRRFTPLAAADAPDGAMLDISGVAHLFGGEAALMSDIEQRLARHGFEARAAAAGTPEAAWALARFGRARAAPPGADEKALRRLFGGLPAAALRLPADIALALSQSGLKCVDDILMRPRAPIAARFGEDLFARLDGLMGRAKSPISPRFEAPAYIAERRFAEAISRIEDVRGVVAGLAVDLCKMLERHGEGARRLEVSLFRVDGAPRRIAASASRPLREPKTIALLFDERIKAAGARNDDDPFDSGYGFDLVRLCAMEVEALGAVSLTLSQRERVAAEPPGEGFQRPESATPHPGPPGRLSPSRRGLDSSLADLLDRLGARLGTRRVMRLVAQDTHIPEFAVAMVPAAEARANGAPGKAFSRKAGEGGRRPDEGDDIASFSKFCDNSGALIQPPLTRGPPSPALREKDFPLPPSTRPLRLFERPEPIETLAEVPDGPPLRFRWRRVMHEVAAIEGPERIAPEWWKGAGDALTRDYFHVEDTSGARFWLYREGLYGAETPRPRWFAHGVFA